MRVQLVPLALILALAVGGYAEQKMERFQREQDALSGQHTAAAQTQLAILAGEARVAAEQSTDRDRVAFYRVAAIAVWKAGAAGESLVVPISDAGAAACDALPAKDQSAPRDSTLIRLVAPLAEQDELTRNLIKLQEQVGQSGSLPSANLATLTTLLYGFETQFVKVAMINASGVPQEPVMRSKRLIYCNAEKALRLCNYVKGVTIESLTASMMGLREQMAQQLPDVRECPSGLAQQSADLVT